MSDTAILAKSTPAAEAVHPRAARVRSVTARSKSSKASISPSTPGQFTAIMGKIQAPARAALLVLIAGLEKPDEGEAFSATASAA